MKWKALFFFLPVTWKVHLPAPASLMTLQVYSPQPSRFRLRMVYSVSSRWASKAPAWSSRLERSHSKRNTREGWARSTLQVITTGLPRPWRISMKTGSTVGGSEQETQKLRRVHRYLTRTEKCVKDEKKILWMNKDKKSEVRAPKWEQRQTPGIKKRWYIWHEYNPAYLKTQTRTFFKM